MQRNGFAASIATTLAFAAPAGAQYSDIPRAKQQPTPLVAPPPASGWLGGTDDCNQPHVDIGVGNVSDIPFTTGTTGSEGQNEALCFAFGTSGIENDTWFDWTADVEGEATLSPCGLRFNLTNGYEIRW